MSEPITFQNPFMAPFLNKVSTSNSTSSAASTESESTTEFEKEFNWDMRWSYTHGVKHMLQLDVAREKASLNAFENDFKSGFRYHTAPWDGTNSPLLLNIRQRGLLDTELYKPVTGEVYYTTYSSGRPFYSRRPDIEFFRVESRTLLIGGIRFERLSTRIKHYPTGKNLKNVDTLESCALFTGSEAPRTLVWRKTQTELEKVKHRWHESDANDPSQPWANEEVVTIELVDPGQPWCQPTCVVRLYNTMPVGRIEIWANNSKADTTARHWDVLDKLVMSAYANMELLRRRMIRTAANRTSLQGNPIKFSWISTACDNYRQRSIR